MNNNKSVGKDAGTNSKMNTVSDNTKNAIRYLLSSFVYVAALTMLYLLDDGTRSLNMAMTVLAFMQICGLIFYIEKDKPVTNKLLKLILKFNRLMSYFSIVALLFIAMVMTTQYHNKMKADAKGDISEIDMEAVAAADGTYVYETDKFYIFFPNFNSVELVFDNRPSKKEEDIIFCAGALFHQERTLDFSHMNLVGDHTTGGEYYDGYEHEDMSSFTYSNGEARFSFDNADDEIRRACDENGVGFEQFMIIHDGKPATFKFSRYRCFRTLTEINGRLCIIDNKKQMFLEDFRSEVIKLGVKDAVYMDMGSGWNYSWIRNTSGKIKNMFNIPVPYSQNWIVFRR